MFCKKCGSTVRDGAEFCPKCGERMSRSAGGSMNQSGSPSVLSKTDQGASKQKSMNAGTKKLLLIAGGVVVLLIILFLILRMVSGGGKESYSLEGTWTSEDAADIEEAIRSLLINEAGIPDWTVDMIMEATGVEYLGDAYVTFSEDGSLWFGDGGTGMAFSIGSFSYEKTGDGTLMLKYSLSLPFVGDVTASYQANYSVSKDRLTLDLFGIQTRFRRQE